jgi:hypothetical protein
MLLNEVKVFQFHLSDDARDHLNSVGWDGDFTPFPEILITRDVFGMGGSERFEPWMAKHYVEVAEVTGANDLEDVFMAGQLGMPNPEGVEINFYPGRMHSVSVGDIVQCTETNTFFMVDREGFTELFNFTFEKVA